MTALRYQPTPGGRPMSRPPSSSGRWCRRGRATGRGGAHADGDSPRGPPRRRLAHWQRRTVVGRLALVGRSATRRFALALPAAAGLPGVTTVEGLWERASYAVAPGVDGPRVVRQERRRAAMHVADWATSRVRWRAGAAFDRWADEAFGSMETALDLRLAGDRMADRRRAGGLGLTGWTSLRALGAVAGGTHAHQRRIAPACSWRPASRR